MTFASGVGEMKKLKQIYSVCRKVEELFIIQWNNFLSSYREAGGQGAVRDADWMCDKRVTSQRLL